METEAQVYRLFVAISLPDQIKAELALAQEELRTALPKNVVRWTRPEQFHLTLKFLGSVDLSQVGAVSDLLRGACSGFPVLRLRSERIGFFPHPRFPRVIWAWVHDAAQCLPLLQQSIEAAVEGIASPEKEGDFTGHITLARCHGLKRAEAEKLFEAAKVMTDRVFGDWEATEVELIRSELRPGGSRYTTLAAFPLARGAAFDTLRRNE